MKILFLSNHVNAGGITAYMLNLAQALHKKDGFEFIVASRGGEWEGKFKKLGVVCLRLPLTTKCEVSPKVFFSSFKLSSRVRQERIDVIHANTRVTQVLAALVSRQTGIPYVSTCHGYFKPRLSRRLFPCWGQKVIAISDQVRDHLAGDFHLSPERIALIYNGINPDFFPAVSHEEKRARKRSLGLNPDKKIIGHIGRLSSVKGQKYLMLAARQLLKKRQDVQFLIIGDGPEEKELKTLREQVPSLAGDVVLMPAVPQTSLALSVMDVFVMPSLQEGLGLSILEAQAQGVPVVASRVGGIPTAVEDRVTGILCPAADPGALAAACEELLGQPLFKEALVQKAKQRLKEKFSLELMAQKTLSVYKDVRC